MCWGSRRRCEQAAAAGGGGRWQLRGENAVSFSYPSDTRHCRVAELAVTVGTVLQNPDEQISEGTVRDEIRFPLK